MWELLLGIDVGTSFCKAVVLDAEGHALAHARVRTPWTQVATGAEIDAEALLRAALAAARDAIAQLDGGAVVAVGVAGMAETGVLLDGRGRPVSPAIAWHDVRGEDAAGEIAAAFGSDRFAMRTGLPPTALCSLAKLRWQRRSLARARQAVRWLGVPEWVARSLGSAEVAELSLASRTGLLSLRERAWWSDGLAWLGVADDFMAEPVLAGTSVGRVGDRLPRARGAHVTVAGHDHLTAMVGAGARGDGDVLHSSGTAEVFVRTIPADLDGARIAAAVAAGVTVGWHVMPERWALLSGNERRAALAAAAEVSAAMLARSDAVAGPHARIVATGGGTRGEAARAAKERWLGPIEWSPVREATARGAALLAGVAAGRFTSVDDALAVPATGLADQDGIATDQGD